jgi:hypothetical protein
MTMRRWATWVLVGGLTALGAVAAADALRGSPQAAPNAGATISVPLIPRNEPAASAMSGVLYYSDADQGCRLRGIRLPGLQDASAPALESCRFSLAPDGKFGLPGDADWSPLGGTYARQDGKLIELGSPASHQTLHFPGRAPAFKPDGTFTYVRGNDVVEWTTACPRDAGLFTLPGDNATARCRRIVARVRSGLVRNLAWLTNKRMALITRASGYRLTIRESRLHVSTGAPGHRISDLQASPRGSFVSVRVGDRLLVLGADGRPVALPPFVAARSIAWSPDERWTAVATQNSVFLFRTNAGEARIRRLPIVAGDLGWRG